MKSKMTKLFAEPPEEIDDTWTWGAMIGGMASPRSQLEMAQSFRLCADTLISRNTRDFEAGEVIYPLLYLYRHAVELYLKAALEKPEQTHDLSRLLQHLESAMKEKLGVDLPVWVRNLIGEIAAYDPPPGTNFRYAEGSKVGELWVDFPQMKVQMDLLFGGLERVILAIVKRPHD